ncbi:hypothetical protein PG997_003060 [Apiospora hydei]|uniref:Uncharacterized protein n=1 Tax=Apiospora hydei TaxID=1337664 RepID=A0ABR1WY93_9PEZI
MLSIKATMFAATSAILLLAGVTQADFVMVDYVSPPPIGSIEPHGRSAYFWEVDDDDGSIPPSCTRGKLWDYKNDVHGDHPGVRVDGDLNDPKAIEVNWGKEEGHWTYRRDSFAGVADHGLFDLNNVQMGECQVAKENQKACWVDGQHGTIRYLLRCQTTYFQVPYFWRKEGPNSSYPYLPGDEVGSLFGSASVAKGFSSVFDS